jgi:acyl-CoA thioester hydrolase
MTTFRFVHPIEVRYADLDPQRHVNNAVVFSYLEAARARYLERLGLWNGADFDEIGIILAETSCRYLAPIVYGQSVEVAVAVTRLGTKSLTQDYVIRDRSTGAELATGRAVLVAYDYHRAQSMAIPPEWRRAIEEFEGREK